MQYWSWSRDPGRDSGAGAGILTRGACAPQALRVSDDVCYPDSGIAVRCWKIARVFYREIGCDNAAVP